MISMPYEEIIQTIINKTGISKEELDEKIKKKLDQLSGLISKDGAAHIVANELGIKLFDKLGGKLKIKEIHSGMRDVETTGKVMRIYELREFTTKSGVQGKVASIIIADETGQIRVVLWNDQADLISKIKEGDILRILGAMARDNNDRKELHLSSKAKVIVNPEGVKIDIPIRQESVRKTISELKGGEQDVELKATIVQVFDIRFFEVCPECGKRAIQKEDGFYCNVHGKVEPRYSNALTLIADDSSGNIRIVTFGNVTAQLLNMSEEEILKFRDNMEEFEDVKNKLLGNIVLFTGRVNRNEMFDRLDFVARYVKPLDIEKEIQRMRETEDVKPEEKSEEATEEDEISEDDLSDFDIDEELV